MAELFCPVCKAKAKPYWSVDCYDGNKPIKTEKFTEGFIEVGEWDGRGYQSEGGVELWTCTDDDCTTRFAYE